MIREALHIFKSEKVSTTCVHVLIVSPFFGGWGGGQQIHEDITNGA